MEDSPLSIIASVTGILTFIAAVLASIYVRYNTLRNGHLELENALQSVQSSIKETTKIMKQEEPVDDPASIELHQIIRDLFELELSICKDCFSAYGQTFPTGLQEGPELDLMLQHRGRVGKFLESAQETKVILESLTSMIPDDSNISLSTVLGYIIRFGETQTLMRWYMIRKNVLEKMQKREHLRSQLLIAQIMAINSFAKKRGTTINNDLSALKVEMSMIRRLATDIRMSLNRNTDAEEGSPPLT